MTNTFTSEEFKSNDDSVKDHYNENLTRNTNERIESQIYHLRGLNNWYNCHSASYLYS